MVIFRLLTVFQRPYDRLLIQCGIVIIVIVHEQIQVIGHEQIHRKFEFKNKIQVHAIM